MESNHFVRILCVDDEPSVLQLLELSLKSQFQIVTASGGQEGLKVLRNQGPFHVVISDMRMPGMDGVAFMKEVRREAPETFRILLTGAADHKVVTDAVEGGDVALFLTKPCPPSVLVQTVKDLLAKGSPG